MSTMREQAAATIHIGVNFSAAASAASPSPPPPATPRRDASPRSGTFPSVQSSPACLRVVEWFTLVPGGGGSVDRVGRCSATGVFPRRARAV
jgi:hypothetical protein